MKENEELFILKETLEEARHQFKIDLGYFDDIKKKCEIFLLMCSLFITLLLSSDFIMKLILNSGDFTLASFLIGLIFLIISIVYIIVVLYSVNLKVVLIDDIIDSLNKYNSKKILKSIINKYKEDMKQNFSIINKKRNLIRYLESFITVGIVFISISLIVAILISY